MKSYRRVLAALCAGVLAVGTMMVPNTEAQAKDYTYNVKDFGADGTDTKDDYAAINEALSQMIGVNVTTTVYIPAGTYYISDSLDIFPNTNLILADGAKIVTTKHNRTMLQGAHVHNDGSICTGRTENCRLGGYNQLNNITITGGTWDENDLTGSGNNGIFLLRHGQNITISNTTLEHATNHFVNISGCQNVTIKNVTFKNAVQYTGTAETFWNGGSSAKTLRYSKIEAIHTDWTNATGEEGCYPADNTGCKNITVSNCTFYKVFAGIGTHHTAPSTSKMGKNLVVKNCSFNQITGYAVNAFGFDGVTFSNDSYQAVSQAAGIIHVKKSKNVKVNNVGLSNTKMNQVTMKSANYIGAPIQVESSSTGNVFKNVRIYSTSPNYTCYVKGNSSATFSGCTIQTPKIAGIYANNSKVYVSDCIITDSLKYGINLTNADGSTITKSRIMDARSHGVYVYKTNKATISYDTIMGSNGYAVYALGTKSSPTTVTLWGDTITSNQKNDDMYFATDCSKNCNVQYCILTKKYFGKAKGINVKTNGNLVGAAVPGKVTLTDTGSTTAKSMEIVWKKFAGAQGYEIEYSTSSNFGYKNMVICNSNSGQKTISGLTGKTYYVRIRAYKTIHNARYYTGWSDVLTVNL